ncbi:MAG: hypothetical protein AAFO91_08145 [Bacteroidota bacterium]
MASGSSLHKGVAVFTPDTRQWSAIEVPGFVNAIEVDEATNTLWIAHRAGVSRYQDGDVFTYDRSNSDLLMTDPEDSFSGFTLAVDKSGIVWYANQNDIYTFIDGEWSLHPLSPLSENYLVSGMVPSQSDGVLIKTPFESLHVLDTDSEIRNYNEVNQLASSSILPGLMDRASDESVIYAFTRSIHYYDAIQDTIIQVDATNSRFPMNGVCVGLDRDLEGNLWVGGDEVLAKLPAGW